MIRQAISCDICGTEKKQTNHWFVAYESSGELRMSGWNSRNRLRPGMKHLCGQTCLHKLIDDFMARTLAARVSAVGIEEAEEVRPAAAATTAKTANDEVESSARLIAPESAPVPARIPFRSQPDLVAISGRRPAEETMGLFETPVRFTPRSRRIDAWDRERERELRAMGHRLESTVRRQSGA